MNSLKLASYKICNNITITVQLVKPPELKHHCNNVRLVNLMLFIFLLEAYSNTTETYTLSPSNHENVNFIK